MTAGTRPETAAGKPSVALTSTSVSGGVSVNS